MFLQNWKQYQIGFRFKQKYPFKEPFISLGLAGKPHVGIDILTPKGVPLIAPFDLNVKYQFGSQGGHQAFVTKPGYPELFRLLHLNVKPKTGFIKQGQQFGATGNSGSATNIPHLHLDISKNGQLDLGNINNFLNPEDYPWEEVQMFVQNILGIKWRLPDEVFFQASVNHALNWLHNITGSQFKISLDLVNESNFNFTTVPAGNTEGSYMVKPEEIMTIGSGWQQNNQKQYQIVTLFADKQKLNPQPGNDLANPVLFDGFTISQKWYQTPNGELQVLANYIIHEWLHNWYFILNQKGINLADDVHDHSNIFDPDPNKNLSHVVLKLKPYWHLLPREKGNMSNAIFYHKAGTQEFGFAFPKTGIEALKDMALNIGREDIIKPDGTIDFSKAREINGL